MGPLNQNHVEGCPLGGLGQPLLTLYLPVRNTGSAKHQFSISISPALDELEPESPSVKIRDFCFLGTAPYPQKGLIKEIPG